MHSDHTEVGKHKHHKPAMQRFESMLGPVMIVVVILVAIGLVYSLTTGDRPPSWMQ